MIAYNNLLQQKNQYISWFLSFSNIHKHSMDINSEEINRFSQPAYKHVFTTP